MAIGLNSEHLEDLRKSGLTDSTIQSMRVSSEPPPDWMADEGVQSILRFEYLRLNGFSPFSRLKLFPPIVDANGKVTKYWQPKGSGVRLYVPEPVIDIFRDKTAPLIICEGEKKTWAAIQAGLPAVGLGGIWNFEDDDTNWLVPELDEVLALNREITYAPDSDVWLPDKRQARLAIYRFGTKIGLRIGRTFSFVKFPLGSGGSKLGMDDFLKAYGAEEFNKLNRHTMKDSAFSGFGREEAQRQQRKAASAARTVKQPPQMTDADARDALAVLNDPELLKIFRDDIAASGCVGEDQNKVTLFLACISRLLKSPINLTIKGESSAGKNYLASSVVAFLPPENLHAISAATPRSLFYLEEDLANSVILIAEAPGSEDADYSIRSMQSESELTILVPEKQGGRIVTKERKVRGPIAFLQTTTKSHLHLENETRNFDLFVDESREQTQAIFTLQNKKALGKIDETKVTARLKVWRNAQRLLKPRPVLIPFVEQIRFPTKPLRVRRDRPRFLAIIEACALLHQYQRTMQSVNGVDHVVATLADYEVAVGLANAVLGRVLSGITPACEKLVAAVSGYMDGNGNLVEFTKSDVQAEMKWSRATVDKYVSEALSLGCIEFADKPRGGTYKYRFVMSADEVQVDLPTRDEVAASMDSNKSDSREGA